MSRRLHDPGTVYLLHFIDPATGEPARYRHAGHYTGNPESSAFLKVGCWTGGRELAELKGSVWVAGWSASGEGWQQVQAGWCLAVAGSGQPQAGAVEHLLDEPQCLREVFRAALVGPAEYVQAVLQLVEGESLGRAGVQLAVFEVAGQERLEDRRVQAVISVPQEVLHWVARGGGLEVEYGHHLQVAAGGWADCGVAGAVVAVQQPGPQPASFADGTGPGQHVPGQRGGAVGLPGAKAGESAEGVQGRQPSAKSVVELTAPWSVQFA